MAMLSFTINFEKFKTESSDLKFESGLNIIYGNSGVGKSSLLQLLLGKKKQNNILNFSISPIELPSSISVIYQNPDIQIITPTIGGELAFSLENQYHNPETISIGVNTLLESLPFVPQLNQNPLTLSGGEKELLNITTAISTQPDWVLIDVGLSFLADSAKIKCIDKLNKYTQRNNSVILWFTSEINDLKYSTFNWELTLTGFIKVDQNKAYQYEHMEIPKGDVELSFNHLFFNYDQRNIFSDLTFNLKPFRSLGITGDNGSGKTTIAQILQGIYKPIKGSFYLAQNNSSINNIAYLDQFPENLLLGRSFNHLLDQLLNEEKINSHLISTFKKRLERFHIQWDAISQIDVMELPWSMLRLTFIVLLTHCEYDLIILDEPSFGLGWKQKVILRQYLIEKMNYKHFIMISHDRLFLEAVSDKILDIDIEQLTTTFKQNEQEETA